MKSYFIPLGLIILSLSLTQCVSTREVMDSWMGHNKSLLYQKWGPPTRVTSDGNGGEILIYERYVYTSQTPGRVFRSPTGKVIGYTSPQQKGYVRSRMFYANEKGIIYYWKARGL